MMLLALTTWAQNTPSSTTGILVVHYGTQNDASRHATIDRLNTLVAEHFKDTTVMEAYVAPAVIKALGRKGISKLTVGAALDSLKARGCRNVVA